MADNKNIGAKSKSNKSNNTNAKVAHKTPTTQKHSVSNRKTSANAKNLPPKNPQKYNNSSKNESGKKQVIAIILFSTALLIFFITVIPGENVWLHVHNFIMGLFGISSYLWPILIGYVAVMIAMEKPFVKIKPTLITVVFLMALISAMIYIFSTPPYSDNFSLKDELLRLYRAGAEFKSAGLFSAILGVTFVGIIGSTGSKILIVMFLFITIMFITRTTLPQLLKVIKIPFSAIMNMAMSRSAKNNFEKKADDISVSAQNNNTSLQGMPKQKLSPVIKQKTDEHIQKAKQETQVQGKQQNSISKENKQQNKVEEIKQKPISSFLEVPVDEPIDRSPKIISLEKPQLNEDELNEDELSVEKEEAIFEESIVEKVESVTASNEIETNGLKEEKHTESTKETFENESKQEDFSKLLIDKVVDDDTHTDINEFQKEDEEKINNYIYPPIEILESSVHPDNDDVAMELNTNGQLLVDTLKSFGVQTKIVNISRGPSVTRYELQPAAGVKISKITSLSDDIAMNLAAIGVRIEAPIPGKSAVGIEVPNKITSIVKIRELLDNQAFENAASKLTVALGKDIAGNAAYTDIAKMPHLLIAGSTGSGKSVCINSILISLLYKANPEEVKLLMVDPKVVELGIYNGIPHLLVPVVTEPRKAAGALNWAVSEMLDRYSKFAEQNVRDLNGYNKKVEEYNKALDNEKIIELTPEAIADKDVIDLKPKAKLTKLPQVVIVIDELADLMMAAPNEVEDSICRLAQMARAAGMHLIIATQRPSVDVITGIIKANIPSRIAFAVSSQVDSRTILDGSGAEKLLGRGDMLFSPIGSSKPKRIQGCFVTDKEIENVIDFIKKSQKGEYDKNVIEEIERNAIADKSSKGGNDSIESNDSMIEDAIKCVVEAGQASTSYLQRKLRLGYARAGRLIDEMEQMGIVGPHEGAKPRQVLITYQQWLERNITNNNINNDND